MIKLLLLLVISTSILFKVNGEPYTVSGVAVPEISLNGNWSILLKSYIESKKDNSNWKPIQVPGECMMQGFKIQHDQPIVYKRDVKIPSDYKNKQIKLRFEGVYSYARLWVNGNYVMDHTGGFTAWEADITHFVTPGNSAMIDLEVTDKSDEISYASGYAKHLIGGILRNVTLKAVPFNYPEQISIETDFDQDYQNGKLIIRGILKKARENNRIQIELFDHSNRKIQLQNSLLSTNDNVFEITNEINHPQKWSAEHPNLYRVKLSFIENGKISASNNWLIGFRKIEIKGNRFLINGNEIKLRGACRHDLHPLLGRVSLPEYDQKDVELAKEANINFIRTSHYPPSENFLRLCDKYGIYVEDETAVCFVDTYRSPEYAPGASENNPEYTSQYLSRLQEMVHNHRNHPSVIIWSIGNENKFGLNFQKSYEWVKKNDPTRPVIFSFPGTVKEVNKPYDILSMHYPDVNGSLEQYGIVVKDFGYKDKPVLFDEWAHVPCYNASTIREDPNVRDFWGMSLDSMWQKTYDADGGLGGAIWGMIDETFMLQDSTVGYGEWGIVDSWRRKKPEFWNVKKAYSPVRLLLSEANILKGNRLSIPVYNRFDCTDLSELAIQYTYKGKIKSLKAPAIPPHSKGIIEIPLENDPLKDILKIDFLNSENSVIDSYCFNPVKSVSRNDESKSSGKLAIREDNNEYVISCGNDLKLIIDKKTGLFRKYQSSEKVNTLSGPWLNFRTKGKGDQTSSTGFIDHGKGWRMNHSAVVKRENSVEVTTSGDYQSDLRVNFVIKIYSDGTIITNYLLHQENPSKEMIRELGIKFEMDDRFDSLSWERNSYWSWYPLNHLSAPKGKSPLYLKQLNVYRKPPVKDWQYDTKSFYYDGITDDKQNQLIFISKATKEKILNYTLHLTGSGNISIKGNGQQAFRIEKEENKIELFLDDLWDYPDLNWGNYQKNILPEKELSGEIKFKINLH